MPTEEEMNTTVNIEELIPQLITALQAVTEKVDEIAARQDELDSVLYDGLIGPANEALAQQEYDDALSDFRAKYSEKLDPFVDVTKSIEGDDFDVYKQAFDSYNEGDYTDVSPDEYVDQLAAHLTEQIEKIKEAVAEVEGVDPEDVEVEVKAEESEEGTPEVTVDVDNETTEEKPEDNEETVEKTESDKEEKGFTDEITTEEPPEETLDEFEKSLRDELDKNPPKVKY